MVADKLEQTSLRAADKGGADRWAEISRECNPPMSFRQQSIEAGEKLAGAVAGMAIGAVAGAFGTENPIGMAVVGWIGAYNGWVYTGKLISMHDQNLVEECIATQPNS
jgi:hypothetical protein